LIVCTNRQKTCVETDQERKKGGEDFDALSALTDGRSCYRGKPCLVRRWHPNAAKEGHTNSTSNRLGV